MLFRSKEIAMKLLRNLMFAVLAGVTLMSPLASEPAAANAPKPSVRHAHANGNYRIYWVYYRTCPDAAWVCYGGYYRAGQAVQAVNYFRYYGYDAFYR
jgi:hypothetical protein